MNCLLYNRIITKGQRTNSPFFINPTNHTMIKEKGCMKMEKNIYKKIKSNKLQQLVFLTRHYLKAHSPQTLHNIGYRLLAIYTIAAMRSSPYLHPTVWNICNSLYPGLYYPFLGQKVQLDSLYRNNTAIQYGNSSLYRNKTAIQYGNNHSFHPFSAILIAECTPHCHIYFRLKKT